MSNDAWSQLWNGLVGIGVVVIALALFIQHVGIGGLFGFKTNGQQDKEDRRKLEEFVETVRIQMMEAKLERKRILETTEQNAQLVRDQGKEQLALLGQIARHLEVIRYQLSGGRMGDSNER